MWVFWRFGLSRNSASQCWKINNSNHSTLRGSAAVMWEKALPFPECKSLRASPAMSQSLTNGRSPFLIAAHRKGTAFSHITAAEPKAFSAMMLLNTLNDFE
jgi:hypothetical protein